MGEWRASTKIVIVARTASNTTATRKCPVPERKKQPAKPKAPISTSRRKPTYVVAEKEDKDGGRGGRRSPKDILAELKREADHSNRVLLATDPDREGEAIAWHIQDALNLDEDRTYRITFNEITRGAVQN